MSQRPRAEAAKATDEADEDAAQEDADLFDALYAQDALYDEDKQLAGRELPPRAWRVSQRAVDEAMDFARRQLDQRWHQLLEQLRRQRLEQAIYDCCEPA